MLISERVAELAKNVPIEDLIHGYEIEDPKDENGVVIGKGAATILGYPTSTTYRYIAEGKLGHVKIEGRARKGRGRAGSVRVRLIDILEFQVRNERIAGTRA